MLMVTRDTVQVLPNMFGGWSVKRYGARRASRNFSTRDEAIRWGRDLSRSRRSELYIHGMTGRVECRIPYSNQDEAHPLPE
jgi:Uncharacterized protein conserved in bacteria (DUF2188)